MMRIVFIITLFALTVSLMVRADEAVLVQSTTSTKNSGFYDYILPLIKADTGITAHVVAVGTGAAIRNAMNCDGDILLVHDRPKEEAFIAQGFAEKRHDVMVNDFILIGPEGDPAGVSGFTDAPLALRQIAESQVLFTSRGDDSGTHSKEMSLWAESGVDPLKFSGEWYRALGSGMGATLNATHAMGAYTITDRASWLTFGRKDGLAIMVEGDERLLNPYGVMLVSAEKCPTTNTAAGQEFIDWLISDKGQRAIGAYQVQGTVLFTPNANPSQ